MITDNFQSAFDVHKPYKLQAFKDNGIYYFNDYKTQKNYTNSIIIESSSEVNINEKIIIKNNNFNWFSLSLFLILAIIALGQIVYNRHQKSLLKSYFQISEFQNYINQISIIRNPYFIGSMFVALINFSLMSVFYNHSDIFGLIENGAKTFGISFLLISAWIIIKYLFLALGGTVYEDKYLGNWYISHETISLSAIGIIIFPLIWINYIEINDMYLTISSYIILSLLLIKVVNMGIILYKKSTFYMFQIILYLCTLEILPVLILVKAVNQGFTFNFINF